MWAEHCTKQGTDFEFETSNYHIKTSSKREWLIVVEGENFKPGEDCHGRKIPSLDSLTQLDMSKKAGLLKIEIITLVLYTGPMVSIDSDELNSVRLWSCTRFIVPLHKSDD